MDICLTERPERWRIKDRMSKGEMGLAGRSGRKGSGKMVLLTIILTLTVVGVAYGALRFSNLLVWNDGGVLSSAAEPAPESGSMPVEESSGAISEPTVSQPEEIGIGSLSMQDLFADYYKVARKKAEQMTVREKVGQVFLFRCPTSGQLEVLEDYQPAGYCLMADAFADKTKEQVRAMTDSFQAASDIPLALCCDEEGGTVVRVSRYPALADQKFQSPQQVFARGGVEAIRSDTVEKIELLRQLGLNMNLAPVADISTNPSDFIYDRSFGRPAEETAAFISTSVNVYEANGFSCVLKHFPGYGNNADTHTGIAYDNRGYDTFLSSDFIPFKAGITAGAPCILVSHNVVNAIDPDAPATLSAKVHEVLREELGFSGVIITDDLSMEAVPQYTGGKNPAVQAFNAGNDLLLSTYYADDFTALYDAVQSGVVSEERLNESVIRVLAWKYAMGILY